VFVLKNVHLRIPDDLYAKLWARRGQVGVSLNDLIIAYIKKCIDDNGFHESLAHINNARKIKG